MVTYRISELAARTGFSASTLRYYERLGLLSSDRSPAGYRLYGDRHVARLALARRAKRLRLSLADIGRLLRDWDSGRCGPVQARLRRLVDAQSRQVTERIADLRTFEAELVETRAGLDRPTPAGPCDDTCGCAAEAGPAAAVACTLTAAGRADRAATWSTLLAAAATRRTTAAGLRFTFPADPLLIGQLAELAVREQECCPFFSFALGIHAADVSLTVQAPPDAYPLLAQVFPAA